MLEAKGIATAALDVRLLMQAVSGFDHAQLIAAPEHVLSDFEADDFERFLNRRCNAEPVSRILGKREFYGRDFIVTPDVLDPRPDTEALIDLCLRLMPADVPFRFADMGAGSGAIAVTLLAERPLSTGVAVDVSPAALSVVRQNAEVNGVLKRLALSESDWFSSLQGSFDLIVSNPPYITKADIEGLAPEVRCHDPLLALDGGDDGLSCYRILAAGAGELLGPQGKVIVEAGYGQSDDIKYIFRDNGLHFIEQALDLSGIVRVLAFTPA
jgi:release factor glutamine methyltransferase